MYNGFIRKRFTRFLSGRQIPHVQQYNTMCSLISHLNLKSGFYPSWTQFDFHRKNKLIKLYLRIFSTRSSSKNKTKTKSIQTFEFIGFFLNKQTILRGVHYELRLKSNTNSICSQVYEQNELLKIGINLFYWRYRNANHFNDNWIEIIVSSNFWYKQKQLWFGISIRW